MVLITLQCDQCVRKWLELNYAPHVEVSWWRSQRMCVCGCLCSRTVIVLFYYGLILFWPLPPDKGFFSTRENKTGDI